MFRSIRKRIRYRRSSVRFARESLVRLRVFSELDCRELLFCLRPIPIRIRNSLVCQCFCREGELILLIQSITDDSRAREFSRHEFGAEKVCVD